MNRSSLFIIIYIIGIILGAVFLDIWSSETTVAKGLIVLGWTALFLICLLYTDKKKN